MADHRDLAEQLLAAARRDNETVEALVAGDFELGEVIGFHAQQCVEKSLKGVLAVRAIAFPFTHDLTRLAELCVEANLSLPSELGEVDRLTPYAVASRYGAEDPKLVDIATCAEWSRHALNWADGLIA